VLSAAASPSWAHSQVGKKTELGNKKPCADLILCYIPQARAYICVFCCWYWFGFVFVCLSWRGFVFVFVCLSWISLDVSNLLLALLNISLSLSLSLSPRDIKPENLLVVSNDRTCPIKVIDFGSAC
jgi:hypothetical protein